MSLTNIHLFSVLKTKLGWHQARQRVLAENVANAETPGYRSRDLKSVDFSPMMTASAPRGVRTAQTHTNHIAGPALAPDNPFDNRRVRTFETTPEGNSVVLEEEMMKVTQNQMDFQAVATIYQRGIGLIRTAIGKQA